VITENHAYTYLRGGRGKVLNARAKQWMADAEAIVRQCIKEQQWKTTQWQKVVVEIKTFWEDNRCRDTHNLYKLLFDSLENAGVFDNDRFGIVHQVDFETDKANPRVELRIYIKEIQGNMPPIPKKAKPTVKPSKVRKAQ
jgi:crossover junction endodeoxyribonuclease RusA